MKPELRPEPKLLLSPQWLLHLKLLALPALELEMFLRQEMEKNPSLEEVPEPEEPSERIKKGEERKRDEFEFADLLPDEGYMLMEVGGGREEEGYEFALPQTTTPVDTLLSLLKASLPKEDFPYAEYILHNLDEDGLLLLSKEELLTNLEIDEARLSKILDTIKRIAPGGIASFKRQELFLAQLELLGYDKESLEYRIIESCYELFLKIDYKAIAKSLGVEERGVREAIERIKTLEPRPLRYYSSQTSTYVEPDFDIRVYPDRIEVIHRDEYIPQLRISAYYQEIVKNPKAFAQEEVEFARKKVRGAVMLIKAIEGRKTMLRKVLEYIVKKEERFFREGEDYLVPLTVKDCARELGLHLSSISRAIQRKYLSTPAGIFPLRYFFASGLGEKPKGSVKWRIKEMIDKEDPSSPLSDEEIVERLKWEGVGIARRTVVKYRRELKIPPSHQRKRGYNNQPPRPQDQ